jgi:hypothetical protein
MPALSYSNADFVAGTKAQASAVNTRFTDIKTLLNTTGLDDTNLANAGITRATKLKTGTVKAFVINDASTGAMSELVPGNSKVITTDSSGVPVALSQLTTALGGTGVSLDPTTGQPGDVVQVNASSTALTLSAPTGVPASLRIFQYLNFG